MFDYTTNKIFVIYQRIIRNRKFEMTRFSKAQNWELRKKKKVKIVVEYLEDDINFVHDKT